MTMRETERLVEALREQERNKAAKRAAELLQLREYDERVGRSVKDVVSSARDIAEWAASRINVDERLVESGFMIPKWLGNRLPVSWPRHQTHAAWILKQCHPNTSYGPQDPTIYTDEDLQGVGLLTDGRIAVFEEPRHILGTLDERIATAEAGGQPVSWSRDFGSCSGRFEALLAEFVVRSAE